MKIGTNLLIALAFLLINLHILMFLFMDAQWAFALRPLVAMASIFIIANSVLSWLIRRGQKIGQQQQAEKNPESSS
jgi:heme/copper-type cytochrome/quinol oxidase subunit 4